MLVHIVYFCHPGYTNYMEAMEPIFSSFLHGDLRCDLRYIIIKQSFYSVILSCSSSNVVKFIVFTLGVVVQIF